MNIYYSSLWQDHNECELNNLRVLPGYRHHHIGHELSEHACRLAKENGRPVISIGIVEENTGLRIWYEADGFEHTGTKKHDSFPFACGCMKKAVC